MQARSIKGGSTEEVGIELAKSIGHGFSPTVGIVFTSIRQDRKAICEILQNNGIDVVGATSCGEFIEGYQAIGSTVILLLDIPRDAYTIVFSAIKDKNVRDAAASLAQAALDRFSNPAFIVCSTGVSVKGDLLDGEAVVRTIEELVGPQVNIYGGMAGDDGTFTGTYIFTHGNETDEGLAALVLDENKISLHGMAISGWKPIGIFRTVTKSKGNLIYTIDDQPALDLYLKYLGKEPASVADKFQIFDEIGLHYPFQVEREVGAPVMRTPMSFNTHENALVCDFDVPQGSKLRFSMPPDFDIVEKVLEGASELKKDRNAEAEAVLIFSCAGRFSALGPLTSSENDGLSEVWNAPMAGFFTYGEYGRAINGKHEFHSTTCCWVALKEK